MKLNSWKYISEGMLEMKVQVLVRAVLSVTCRFFGSVSCVEEFGKIDLIIM
jgi:hypothetical protein